MAKTKAKQTTVSPKNVQFSIDNNTNVSVRKIENGFIVRESGYKKLKKGEQYFEREKFSQTNPVQIKTPGRNFTGKK